MNPQIKSRGKENDKVEMAVFISDRAKSRPMMIVKDKNCHDRIIKESIVLLT